MLSSDLENIVNIMTTDTCYKLMHMLDQKLDDVSCINDIRSQLTPSGIYSFYDTSTQKYEYILIEKICDDRAKGYRVSDGNDIDTPIISISLEKTCDYLSRKREKYALSQLPTKDEIPLLGITEHGFPILCAGFKLENGSVYIFSPIVEDEVINKNTTEFYVATDKEREVMNTMLGK